MSFASGRCADDLVTRIMSAPAGRPAAAGARDLQVRRFENFVQVLSDLDPAWQALLMLRGHASSLNPFVQ
jgi:hypothetical protein